MLPNARQNSHLWVAQSAGFDLSIADKTIGSAGGRAVVNTDLSIVCARIARRRVVDAEYQGNVGVGLFNFGPSDFEVNLGDRIGTPYLLLSLDGGGVTIFRAVNYNN
mmetsp:Transcript_7586/g.12208  ORF Transcript_7586/g.12208 Transcript_7586/m.12208 type:complete len:107 (+) Transcript_7586:202-522(+)